jgi:two-component system chemotaxis sensor kinase CheA
MQGRSSSFILAIDGFMGREDAVIKSLDDFRPKGVSGVTTLSNGKIVLILDMKEPCSVSAPVHGFSRGIGGNNCRHGENLRG